MSRESRQSTKSRGEKVATTPATNALHVPSIASCGTRSVKRSSSGYKHHQMQCRCLVMGQATTVAASVGLYVRPGENRVPLTKVVPGPTGTAALVLDASFGSGQGQTTASFTLSGKLQFAGLPDLPVNVTLPSLLTTP